jgi:hypothetical protein
VALARMLFPTQRPERDRGPARRCMKMSGTSKDNDGDGVADDMDGEDVPGHMVIRRTVSAKNVTTTWDSIRPSGRLLMWMCRLP